MLKIASYGECVSKPRFSIIMPAFNSEATLERALRSIRAQKGRSDWEAIVVDDGSADATLQIAQRWSIRDPRIRSIRIAHAGASTARNAGIAAAAGEWLIFLDADDTLHPRYLALMSKAAECSASIGGVCCGYVRIGTDGRRTAFYSAPPLEQDPFLICAGGPPTCIHGFMIQRAIIQAVGCFDVTLSTNEDWDLWVRVARVGTEFAVVKKELAEYWDSNASSLTKGGRQMMRDALVVMRRVRSRDERVPNPLPQYADGAALGDPMVGLFSAAIWNAGILIGKGADGRPLLADIEPSAALAGAAIGMSSWLVDGLMIGAQTRLGNLITLWPKLRPDLQAFLRVAAEKMKNAALEAILLRAVEIEVLTVSNFRQPADLSATRAIILSPRMVLRGYEPTKPTDLVVFRIPFLRPRGLFRIPVVAFGPLSGAELRRIIGWRMLTKLLTKLLRNDRTQLPMTRLWRVAAVLHRKSRALLPGPRMARPPWPTFELPRSLQASVEAIRSQAILPELPARHRPASAPSEPLPSDNTNRDRYAEWDEFFQTENPWHYDSAYEQSKYERTLSMLPTGRVARAVELACAEGHFTSQLAARVDHVLAVDISSKALERARDRCKRYSNIEYLRSDFFVDPIGGNWDLIVCSEVLYYMGDTSKLADFVQRVSGALNADGYFLHAHAFEVTDKPSRGRTGFDWNDPFAAATIVQAFEADPHLRRVRTITTELYRIDLFRKTTAAVEVEEHTLPLGCELERSVASHVVWNGAVRTRPEVATERQFIVPVLMYHRVADDGPAELAAYRVEERNFEHQLRFLRRRGYRSISPAEWMEASRNRGSIRGRPILLTFDDAYLDFYQTAWPLIADNGFSAHVFVPTGKVGGTSDWDAEYGTPAPLMTWEQIAELADQGVTFGSHLSSHTAADLMSSPELLQEAVSSRALLEAATGQEIRTVAPPFGAMDVRTEQILSLAGYTQLFADRGAAATVARPGLYTPRIPVNGFDRIEAFAERIDRLDEPPEPADVP